MYLVTFRGQSITVQADSHALAGKAGLEALGFVPRLVGQHDLTIIKL